MMCCRMLRSFGLALACLGVFGVCVLMLVTDSVVVRWDRSITASAFRLGDESPRLYNAFNFITDLGAHTPLWYVGGAAILILIWQHEAVRALLWLTGMLTCRPISPWLKAEFARQRPEHLWTSADSFPSGHAFGSAVVYGMLALVILHTWQGNRWRWVAAGVVWVWIGLVGVSRLILGVHFPTDVIAGTALGIGWGLFFSGLADVMDWLRLRRCRPT